MSQNTQHGKMTALLGLLVASFIAVNHGQTQQRTPVQGELIAQASFSSRSIPNSFTSVSVPSVSYASISIPSSAFSSVSIPTSYSSITIPSSAFSSLSISEFSFSSLSVQSSEFSSLSFSSQASSFSISRFSQTSFSISYSSDLSVPVSSASRTSATSLSSGASATSTTSRTSTSTGTTGGTNGGTNNGGSIGGNGLTGGTFGGGISGTYGGGISGVGGSDFSGLVGGDIGSVGDYFGGSYGGGDIGGKKPAASREPATSGTCATDDKFNRTCIPLIQPLGSESNIILVKPGAQSFIEYFDDASALLITIAVGFCVLWILIGSYMIMISGSDGGKRATGKSIITWALIGLILVNFAGFFLKTLNNIFFV